MFLQNKLLAYLGLDQNYENLDVLKRAIEEKKIDDGAITEEFKKNFINPKESYRKDPYALEYNLGSSFIGLADLVEREPAQLTLDEAVYALKRTLEFCKYSIKFGKLIRQAGDDEIGFLAPEFEQQLVGAGVDVEGVKDFLDFERGRIALIQSSPYAELIQLQGEWKNSGDEKMSDELKEAYRKHGVDPEDEGAIEVLAKRIRTELGLS